MLLTSCPSAANSSMYNDNRPLHSAATLSGVTEQQQLEMVNILLEFGADKACRNKANKLPVELVQQGREKVRQLPYSTRQLDVLLSQSTSLLLPTCNRRAQFFSCAECFVLTFDLVSRPPGVEVFATRNAC